MMKSKVKKEEWYKMRTIKRKISEKVEELSRLQGRLEILREREAIQGDYMDWREMNELDDLELKELIIKREIRNLEDELED